MENVTVERLRQVDGNWAWVPELVQLNTAEDFKIDENEIGEAIERTSVQLCQYGGLAADLKAQLSRKEKEIEFHYNTISAAHRLDSEEAGEKLTEGKLKEKVVKDERYQQVLSDSHITRADALKVENFWKAMVEKAKLLNSLCYFRGQELHRGM